MLTCGEIKFRAIGNAIFSYASLLGIGAKLNFPIRIPRGEHHIHQPTGQKIWQLKDIFDITTPYISDEEIKNIAHSYTEKHKGYDDGVFGIADNTNLIGFWQNELYFADSEIELRKQLVFKKEWIYEAAETFDRLNVNPDKCIAIHVRRGDYERLKDFHPILPADYYVNSLQYIRQELILKGENIEEYKLLVFSDDIESCQKDFNPEYFTFCDNANDSANIVDLCMMTQAKSIVIANSSFSWWGAWLGKRKDFIIAPRLWFGPGYAFGGVDIPSSKWIKI